jgi:nucleotide-binding universal stress UspA family protein
VSSGVIVGYDGSETAKAAVRAAIEVGHAYGEEVVIAVAYELSPIGGEIYDYAAALKELARQRVAEAAEVATAHGGDSEVEGVIIEQDPARALAELATERDARVIVVGTRGESPLKGALLGSTPHKLLHLADRPVLVVPAPGS